MKNARMLPIVCLIVITAQAVHGEDPSRPRSLAKHDQLQISVQKICPVSGGKLGEHGPPVKVRVGKENVFLCCRGCLKEKIKPEHWATIHANFAQAQRICPVMKHKLPKNPKWTIVDGRIVFVCCPPCTKKIAADPATYLKKLDELYTASLKSSQTRR